MKKSFSIILLLASLVFSFSSIANSISIKKPKKIRVSEEGTWYSFQASSKGDMEVTLRNGGKWNNIEYTKVTIWEKVNDSYVEVSGGNFATELVFLNQGIIRMKAKGLKAGSEYYISADDRLDNKWKFYFKSNR